MKKTPSELATSALEAYRRYCEGWLAYARDQFMRRHKAAWGPAEMWGADKAHEYSREYREEWTQCVPLAKAKGPLTRWVETKEGTGGFYAPTTGYSPARGGPYVKEVLSDLLSNDPETVTDAVAALSEGSDGKAIRYGDRPDEDTAGVDSRKGGAGVDYLFAQARQAAKPLVKRGLLSVGPPGAPDPGRYAALHLCLEAWVGPHCEFLARLRKLGARAAKHDGTPARQAAAGALRGYQWRLVRYMWERDEADEMEVIDHVWGHDSDRGYMNLASLINKANTRLREAGVPVDWKLGQRGGMVVKKKKP